MRNKWNWEESNQTVSANNIIIVIFRCRLPLVCSVLPNNRSWIFWIAAKYVLMQYTHTHIHSYTISDKRAAPQLSNTNISVYDFFLSFCWFMLLMRPFECEVWKWIEITAITATNYFSTPLFKMNTFLLISVWMNEFAFFQFPFKSFNANEMLGAFWVIFHIDYNRNVNEWSKSISSKR